jgi:hypothetical protein
MTYWLREAATNVFVGVIVLGAAVSALLYVALTIRGWLKRLFEQAAFMIPHHVGTFSSGRSISPGLFVIELRPTLVVWYAKDLKDADQVCKGRWLRKGLRSLIIDDAPVWNGQIEIAVREADVSERIQFMNAMQRYDGILLDRSEAGGSLNFVLVDRNKQRLVKIGCA